MKFRRTESDFVRKFSQLVRFGVRVSTICRNERTTTRIEGTANMAKHNLAEMTSAQLLNLVKTDPTAIGDITTEIDRRGNQPAPSTGEVTVDWNSAGQVFVMEATPTTLSSTGGLYRGQANIAVSIASLIIADSPAGESVRKKMRELIAQPKDVIQARVAEKKTKKSERQEKELASDRKDLENLIKKGFAPASALIEFDAKNGIVAV